MALAMESPEPGLRYRMRRALRQMGDQHRGLREIHERLASALAAGNRREATDAFVRFRHALGAHFELEEGVFFPALASVSPRTHAPVLAILLQGAVACLIALTGTYGQILSYVVSVDFIWFALTGAALVVFRRRDREPAGFQVPGHPVTTWFFILACAITVIGTVAAHPVNSAIGFAILAAGVPVCLFWLRRREAA